MMIGRAGVGKVALPPEGGTRDIYWWGCALEHQKRGVLGAGTAQKGGVLGGGHSPKKGGF